MKNVCVFVFMLILSCINMDAAGQNKKSVSKKTTVKNSISKTFTEPRFAGLIPITEISDINPEHPVYNAVRILTQDYKVPLAYSNKTFMPKNGLKRGEFIIYFNSALESIRNFMDSMKHDTSLINTYDKHASYITSAGEIKDLKQSSVYFPAVQSMLERWGIAAMFTKAKLLRANSSISEAEVYDILKVTMGFNNPAIAKRTVAIRRDAFAVMLSDAISQLLQRALRLPKPVPDKVSDTFYIKMPFDTLKK